MLRLAVKFEEMLGVPVDVVLIDEINPQSRIRVFNEGFVVLEGRAGVYECLLLDALAELALVRTSV
jgi:hypothetical protein